ncbi:BTAD domain-containing putative transcriptional regulator [Streptomyces angustmyceticus]|uniref:AfsR/SARP family transcriptional regulator n=1 Tax=Streptomyces angustmyceticus TaxID=285578 RepID=UPI001478324A|nr:BTAD domain-containing putative transcriptional regulator [Streptomyces angustmyceticus]UAL68408.1 AAA family ATPase [Streptomyces angustmyceticus]
MRFRILGATEVLDAQGQPVPLGGARVRALVAALALRGGRPVTVRTLIDEVWADAPPQDAPGALQALVGRLRRTLGKGAVESLPGAYRLVTEPDEVDLLRFERLVDAGTCSLQEGDAAAAAETLRTGLALWRGPVLRDLPGGAGAAHGPEALRLAALHGRIDADLALGRAEELLPELRQLTADHPLDEPFRAQLMRALHGAGRGAAALAVYEQTRQQLADRLGADPGPELRALHAQLLAQSPGPDVTGPDVTGPEATGPEATGSDTTAGEPAASEVMAPGALPPGATAPGTAAPDVTPAATTAPNAPPGPTAAPYTAPPGTASPDVAPSGATPPDATLRNGNLRARLNSFVGREAELTSLQNVLRSRRTRLVTLTGAGGSGKTRLAEQLAGSLAAEHPDGVWVTELAPLDSPEAVPGAVLSALGRRDTTVFSPAMEARRAAEHADPAARIIDHCASRRLLLVLDNCEHVVGAAAALADLLLRHCPGLTVVATSREPLGVPGETVRPLEPLPPAPAHQLFTERAVAVRPEFRAADDPAAVDEICRRLDGLPLAIELAAARLRLLSPRQIAGRLDDRFRLLTSGSRTALPRQQTLRAVVDWSWELLDEPERALLRRLSVFAGGCTLPAAEAVCGEPAEDVLGLLGALVDKSLLVVDHRGAEPRYRMLETIHAYARERAAGRPEEHERTLARHTRHFLDFVTDAEPRLRSAEQLPWLARTEAEVDNVRAVLHRAVTGRDVDTAQRVVLAMGWFWWLRNYREEGASWVDRTAALHPAPEHLADTDPVFWAQMELRLLRLFLLQDQRLDRHADIPQNRALIDRLLTAYRDPHPRSARFPGLLWPFTAFFLGSYDEILSLMDGAVATTRALGGSWELGVSLMFRTHLAFDLPGGLESAEADEPELAALARRVGDRWMLAQVASATGQIRQLRGRYDEARTAYEEALALTCELGAHSEGPFLLSRLAELHFAAGDVDGAEKALIRADEQAVEWGVQDPQAFNHLLRARIALWHGRPEAAREACEAARQAAALGTPPPYFAVVLDAFAGRLAAETGELTEALSRCHQALSFGLTLNCTPPVLAAAVESAAPALRRAGRPDAAARLLGAADAWRGDLPRTVPEQEDVRHTAATLRAVLDDAGAGGEDHRHEGDHDGRGDGGHDGTGDDASGAGQGRAYGIGPAGAYDRGHADGRAGERGGIPRGHRYETLHAEGTRLTPAAALALLTPAP